MDNGSILLVFLIGPLLPVTIAIPAVLVFGIGYVVHALTGVVISSVVEGSRPRRERAYVRKHQRDISDL
ncbi:hypothetical protein [Microbacterium sp. PMB16]|uniref:hypothetical protein n=1 Tax=Microbacterium sp. PMB16 TaxID=3120157 RepID=UPI003F4BAB09